LDQACPGVTTTTVNLCPANLVENGKVLARRSLLLSQALVVVLLTTFQVHQGPRGGQDRLVLLVLREKEDCQVVMVLVERMVSLAPLVTCSSFRCKGLMVKVRIMLRHSDKCLVNTCLR